MDRITIASVDLGLISSWLAVINFFFVAEHDINMYNVRCTLKTVQYLIRTNIIPNVASKESTFFSN